MAEKRRETRLEMSDFTGAGGAAYMSNRMNWETPTDLFAQLDREFHFTLDAASSETNRKCEKHYTAEDSAFDHSWGGGDSLLQSPVWASNQGLGAQMQYGGQSKEHHCRYAAASPHGYQMVPAIYSQPCGGQVPQRQTPFRGGRHTGRPGTIPKHDRRDADRRKVNEGDDAHLLLAQTALRGLPAALAGRAGHGALAAALVAVAEVRLVYLNAVAGDGA